MSVDKTNLSWLTTVPASDINFKNRLKEANLDTMHASLKKRGLSKTARKAIKARIIKIVKEREK